MQVHTIPLRFEHDGSTQELRPVLICAGSENILVDCGYPGFAPLLEEGLQKLGTSLKHITGIIITHHDIDHLGALHEIKDQYPGIRVYAAAMEAPYIDGSKKSLRLQQAEDLHASLPEDQRPAAEAFQQFLKSVKPVKVDELLEADAEIPFLKGVQVVHTPGHLPGHISLFIPNERLLVAADALVIENGGFEIANPQFTFDMNAAIHSIEKILALAPEKVICFHGGLAEQNILQGLKTLISRYRRYNSAP